MTKTMRIVVLALAQFLLLGGMIAGYAWDLTRGTEIIVETQPVDPRSLFRGNYVRLGYAFTEVPATVADPDCYRPGESVYVDLENRGEGWLPVRASKTRLEAANTASRVTLQGRMTTSVCYDAAAPRPTTLEAPGAQTEAPRRAPLRLDYGISAYFAAPETAQALERRMRGREGEEALRMILSVPPSGRALIKGTVIDGEKRYDQTLW